MKKNYTIVGSGILALGLFCVCGCKTTVMDERKYRPADEPTAKNSVAESPEKTTEPAPEQPAENTPAVKSQTAEKTPAYAPMDGTWDSNGIADKNAKGAKKSGRKIQTAANGVYVVKSGDTLGKIAYKHGVSLGAVMKANNFDAKKAARIYPGQKIMIPGKNGKVSASAAAAVKTPAKKGAQKLNTALLNADGTYTVKAGDSIPKIARKLGVKSKDLQSVNNLSDEATRRLQIGQKLQVPGKSAATPAPGPAANQDDLDAILKDAEKPAETPSATPVETSAPAETVTVAPATSPVPATAPVNNVVTDSTFLEIQADTTLEEVANKHKTTVEALRKLNAEVSADGKLKAGEIIFIPVAR